MNTFLAGNKRDWSELLDLLNQNQRFVFSTHLEPDADGLGAELGLARVLRSMGKEVHIFNPSQLRANLAFLPAADEVQVFNAQKHTETIARADLFIAFDIGHYSRLTELCPVIESESLSLVSIDHHPGDKSQFDLCFDDPSASSTGVMIYDLIGHLKSSARQDLNVALPLYAAMMSDTGNFRFNNTDPETLRAAADMVAAGVQPYELYVELYENLNTPSRLKVIQHIIEHMQFDMDGRLAWAVVDIQKLKDGGVQTDDLHSLSDFIRSVYGVEIGAAITKIPGNPTDVSLRSKGHIPVNGVAKHFGGGGHAFAAGCRLDGDLESDAELLIEQCRLAISNWDDAHAEA